jgi:transcription antitermination protein NusB
MLSRRHLRIKALQALYAFYQSGNDDLAQGEKQLLKSTDKLYELYIYQLSFLVKMVDYASGRIEEAKKKFFPTPEDLHPNLRLIENRVIAQIAENKDFGKWSRALKINWSDQENLFHRCYQDIRANEAWNAYLNIPGNSYRQQKDAVILLVREIFSNFELLRQYYEDISIFWSDEDFDTSLMMVIKTVKAYQESWGPEATLPSLYKTDPDDDDPLEDKQFMIKLFHATLLKDKLFEGQIEQQVENWELERIAIMDMIIMKMALAELVTFPSIPVKVSINEYIEISKTYSSIKSKFFINGILDKLVIKMKEDGTIQKTGRGLIE